MCLLLKKVIELLKNQAGLTVFIDVAEAAGFYFPATYLLQISFTSHIMAGRASFQISTQRHSYPPEALNQPFLHLWIHFVSPLNSASSALLSFNESLMFVGCTAIIESR